MPIIASAKKKLRQDKKRRLQNRIVIETVKKAVKKAKLTPTLKNLTYAYSVIDSAVKKNVIHKNKAARTKSKLAKAQSKPKK